MSKLNLFQIVVMLALSHSLQPLWEVLLCIAVALSATVAYGQQGEQGPPPGGYPLRRVKHLTAVPEPSGRLVPYRVDDLWGYCDTLGRVWIKPAFKREPTFFAQGFAYAPNQVDNIWKPSTLPEVLLKESHWLNARGEYLLNDARHAVVRAGDGGLRRIARRRNRSGRELGTVYRSVDGRADSLAYRNAIPPLRPGRGSPEYAGHGVYQCELRSLWWVRGMGLLLRRYLAGVRMPADWVRILIDSRGRRLTGRRYGHIYPFVAGFARTERKGANYLSSRARRLLRRDADVVGDFYNGQAVVVEHYSEPNQLTRVIDTSGRATLVVQGSWRVSVGDPVGWIVKSYQKRMVDSTKARYLTADGKEPFSPNRFDGAERFWSNRAWARQGARCGLINRRGEWVTKESYDWLYWPAEEARDNREDIFRTGGKSYDEFKSDGQYHWCVPDTTVMLAKRGAYKGLVSRRTGREVVPLRYQGYKGSLGGKFLLERDGETYLVDAHGKELVHAPALWPVEACGVSGVLRMQQADNTWCLIDSLGRRRTRSLAPITQLLYYNAASGHMLVERPGRLSSHKPDYQLLDSSGRTLLDGWGFDDEPRLWPHYLTLNTVPKDSLALVPRGVALYDYQGHRGLPGYYADLTELPGQWIAAAEFTPLFPGDIIKPGERCQNCGNTLLISPTGRYFQAPPKLVWALPQTTQAERLNLTQEGIERTGLWPFVWGVQPVQEKYAMEHTGYVTRRGTRLFILNK